MNRVWARHFGAGLVDPPDDMNLANPASHPKLLDWLSQEFVKREYNMKWLHRTIVTSRTFQLSSRTNQRNRVDRRNLSHWIPRRLPAEVLIDATLQATAGEQSYDSWFEETKNRKIAQHPRSIQTRGIDYSLLVFGKPLRTTNCDCERQDAPTLLQSLFTRNDSEMLGWIERPDGWLIKVARNHRWLLKSDVDDNRVLVPGSEPTAATDDHRDFDR